MAARALIPVDPVDAIMAVMEGAFAPAFGEAWSRRQVSDALLLGNCHYALIGRDGTITDDGAIAAVGFCLSRTVADEEELLLFAVAPENRGNGTGSRLLRYFVERAKQRGTKRLFLEMRDGNPAARLYEKLGFRRVGRRPAYYRGNDGMVRDALSYTLSLD